MNIITQFFKRNPQKVDHKSINAEMMRREAELTRNIFGPVAKGGRREFFNIDPHTWVWHEEWTNDEGVRKVVNTRYLIREREIIKSQNNGPYRRVSISEAERFKKAVDTYVSTVKSNLYTNEY